MLSTTRSIARHFSQAAASYEELSAFHRRLAEELVLRLPPKPAVRRALDVACGTGVVSTALSRRFPAARIDAVDVADGMIDAASARNAGFSSINWIRSDIRRFDGRAGHYDLIVSGAALHWIQPIHDLFALLQTWLPPGGALSFTIMLRGTLEELHGVRREIAPQAAPQAFLPDAEQVVRALQESGFQVGWLERRRELVYYSDASAFFRTIKMQGFTGGALSQGRRPLTRGELFRAIAEYQQRFGGRDGRVPASYLVALVRANRR